MPTLLEVIGRFCRFCLRREDLMALSEATSSSFSIADAQHYTGIELPESEGDTIYAVCLECCSTIKNSVCFRRSCLNNDVTFKQLVAVLEAHSQAEKSELAVEFLIETDSDGEHSAEEGRFEETVENDLVIERLDDSDFDYSMPGFNGEAISDESKSSSGGNVQPTSIVGEEEQKENTVCFNQSKLEMFNGSETGDYMPSLDGKDAVLDGSIELNCISSDSSDSNDSLPSLYGEVMRKAIEDERTSTITTTSVKSEIEAHSKDEPRHVCPICGGLYVNVRIHLLRSHGTEKRFTCPHCQKKYSSRFYLKRHINTWHEKRIILTCEHCGKGFTNHGSHYSHVVNSHGKSDLYQCETCHRKFRSFDGYKKHQKEHSIASYSCLQCDKFFTRAATLEKHQLRHHAS